MYYLSKIIGQKAFVTESPHYGAWKTLEECSGSCKCIVRQVAEQRKMVLPWSTGQNHESSPAYDFQTNCHPQGTMSPQCHLLEAPVPPIIGRFAMNSGNSSTTEGLPRLSGHSRWRTCRRVGSYVFWLNSDSTRTGHFQCTHQSTCRKRWMASQAGRLSSCCLGSEVPSIDFCHFWWWHSCFTSSSKCLFSLGQVCVVQWSCSGHWGHVATFM